MYSSVGSSEGYFVYKTQTSANYCTLNLLRSNTWLCLLDSAKASKPVMT